MSFRTRSTRRHSLDSRRDVNCGGRLHNLHLFTGQRQARGQDLVEFALLVPLLLLIFFGALDLGRAFFSFITINSAARVGARHGVLYGIKFTVNTNTNTIDFSLKDTEVENVARQEIINSGFNTANIELIDAQCIPSGDCSPGNEVKVTIVYDFELVMGWVLPDSTLRMTRSVTMLIP